MLSCHDNGLRGHSAQGAGRLRSPPPRPRPAIYFQPLIAPRFLEWPEAFGVARVARGHSSPAGSSSDPMAASCPIPQPAMLQQPGPSPKSHCPMPPHTSHGGGTPSQLPCPQPRSLQGWGAQGKRSQHSALLVLRWQEAQAGLQRAGSVGWSCRVNAISQLHAPGNIQEGKEAPDVISAGCQGSMLLPKHPSFVSSHPALT